MVLSSFESVAGLSSSTPYVSKALKSVSRQFKYLENAISDQLKHIQEVLGEEVTASTSAGTTSSSKFVSNMARVRFMDQSFQKNKFILGSTGLLEHQHHAWRPHQKGLPERAVAVLRAWLFDHFLHPYDLSVSIYICPIVYVNSCFSFCLNFIFSGTPRMQINTC